MEELRSNTQIFIESDGKVQCLPESNKKDNNNNNTNTNYPKTAIVQVNSDAAMNPNFHQTSAPVMARLVSDEDKRIVEEAWKDHDPLNMKQDINLENTKSVDVAVLRSAGSIEIPEQVDIPDLIDNENDNNQNNNDDNNNDNNNNKGGSLITKFDLKSTQTKGKGGKSEDSSLIRKNKITKSDTRNKAENMDSMHIDKLSIESDTRIKLFMWTILTLCFAIPILFGDKDIGINFYQSIAIFITGMFIQWASVVIFAMTHSESLCAIRLVNTKIEGFGDITFPTRLFIIADKPIESISEFAGVRGGTLHVSQLIMSCGVSLIYLFTILFLPFFFFFFFFLFFLLLWLDIFVRHEPKLTKTEIQKSRNTEMQKCRIFWKIRT